jgi:hypothetical protein
MTDYTGEGLIKCQDCGATVPSFESLIDLPGAPEHMTPCFRPALDATRVLRRSLRELGGGGRCRAARVRP